MTIAHCSILKISSTEEQATIFTEKCLLSSRRIQYVSTEVMLLSNDFPVNP